MTSAAKSAVPVEVSCSSPATNLSYQNRYAPLQRSDDLAQWQNPFETKCLLSLLVTRAKNTQVVKLLLSSSTSELEKAAETGMSTATFYANVSSPSGPGPEAMMVAVYDAAAPYRRMTAGRWDCGTLTVALPGRAAAPEPRPLSKSQPTIQAPTLSLPSAPLPPPARPPDGIRLPTVTPIEVGPCSLGTGAAVGTIYAWHGGPGSETRTESNDGVCHG